VNFNVVTPSHYFPRFDSKGRSMHARFALMLVVAGLAALVCRPAVAEFPDPYEPQPAANENVAAPQQPGSVWPAAATPVAASSATPGLLPSYEGARPIPAPVRGTYSANNTNTAVQASAESRSPAGPLPLAREAGHLASPLGPERLPPVVSTAASLGLVAGLFLLVVWSVRRGMPKGAGLLPSEAVEVLGRAPLAGRQQVHLVRCGNKLVLVTITAAGTQALAEITDPAEVERLHALCQPAAPAGALRHWLGQFTSRAKIYREHPDDLDFRHLDGGQHRA
jgi:flagellar biogenesis protein FliO